jgi:DHA1 family multidrug resistance protein-like MFS transporter
MPNLKILFAIGSISSLGVLAGSIIAPIEAHYIQSFTDDPILIGSVFGMGSIFFALLSYWIGRLSDSYGRKRIILTGLAFGIIYAVLYSMVLNVLQIYGVKFTWAITAIATGPVMAAYLQDFLKPFANKGTYFGYVYSVQSISGSVGALAGGYLAATFGLSTPFYLVAVIYFALFAIAFFALPADQQLGHIEQNERKNNKKSLTYTLKYIVSKPVLLFYLSVNTSFGINWGIKAFLWPLVIFEIAKNDLITGSIFATMGAVAFVLLPFAGKAVDAFGSYRIILFELAILGVAGLGLALSGNITMFWVFAALYTIGEVLNGPAQAALLTENVDSEIRGQVMGLDATLDQLLAVLSPFVAGLLITILGLTTTFLIFMLLFWASIILGVYIYLKHLRAS